MGQLKNKKLFLLDMDGTIYIDTELFDGTLDFLSRVRDTGGRYLFLTNNSSKGVDAYVKKLASMGIVATEDVFLTSVNATVVYLRENFSDTLIYASGTRSFVEQLSVSGLNITTELSNDIGCFVMGFDTELTFDKLERACIILNRGVPYIATNPDPVCPTWYGSVPDCGSVADMLYNATKRRPKFIGKPSPEMINLALEKTGYSRDEAVIVGDRLYTDIRSGVNAGISSAFVLSGEGTLEDLKDYDFSPTYIFKNIREMYNDLISED